MTRRQEHNITSHIEFFGFLILATVWDAYNGDEVAWLSYLLTGLAVFSRISYWLTPDRREDFNKRED